MIPKIIATLAISFLGISIAYAQTVPANVVIVSCSPNSPVDKNHAFPATLGDTVVLKCSLKNSGNTKATVFISGERNRESANSQPTDTTSTASSVEIPPNSTVDATVPFITLFENGSYLYTITLKNFPDGKPFGTALSFASVLDAPTIRIVDAKIDKETYSHGDTGFLVLTVATSSSPVGGESVRSFFLTVVLKGENGETCTNITSDRSIVSAEESVPFLIPATPDTCSATSLNVTLNGKKGPPQDSQDIPLTVSGMGGELPATTASTTTQFTLILLAIVALAGLVWVLRLRRDHTVL